jgi:hypothetical protein
MNFKIPLFVAFVFGLSITAKAQDEMPSKRIDVESAMQSVPACKKFFGTVSDPFPSTVTSTEQKITVGANAASAKVSVYSKERTYVLLADQGEIRFDLFKEKGTLLLPQDKSEFIFRLDEINRLVNQALGIAKKTKDQTKIDHIQCAVEIIKATKAQRS